MPGINDVKDNKYLSKEDCEPALVATINGWKHENLAMDGQPPKMKYVLYFNECKPLVLNNTNAQRVALVVGSGDDFNKWIGHQITLFNDKTVEFQGNFVGGVRVYVQQNEPVVPQQQPQNQGIPSGQTQGVQGQVYPAAGQNVNQGNPNHQATIANAVNNNLPNNSVNGNQPPSREEIGEPPI